MGQCVICGVPLPGKKRKATSIERQRETGPEIGLVVDVAQERDGEGGGK
jgi:hypothetical protein